MHRTNEEAYVNPESHNRRAKTSVDWTGATSRAEDKDSSSHRVSDNKGIHLKGILWFFLHSFSLTPDVHE